MKFSDQTFFYYERELWMGRTFDALFRDKTLDAGLTPVSGLADLREALLITDEWYRQFPVVSFQEVKTSCGSEESSVDVVDGEPSSGTLEFGRIVNVHAVVKQDESETNLRPMGRVTDQNIQLHLSLLQLRLVDYWPNHGDRIFFLGRVHDIISVTTPPSDYWQNSGVPVHIRVVAEITNFSGDVPRYALDDGSPKVPLWLNDDGREPLTDSQGYGGVRYLRSAGIGQFAAVPTVGDVFGQGSSVIIEHERRISELEDTAVTQESQNW